MKWIDATTRPPVPSTPYGQYLCWVAAVEHPHKGGAFFSGSWSRHGQWSFAPWPQDLVDEGVLMVTHWAKVDSPYPQPASTERSGP